MKKSQPRAKIISEPVLAKHKVCALSCSIQVWGQDNGKGRESKRGARWQQCRGIVGKVWVPLKYREKKGLSRGTAETDLLSQRPEKNEKNEKN